MKYTNKYNAPQALVNLIEDVHYQFTPNSFGATTLNQAPTEVLLNRRHDAEIEKDVTEEYATLFGTVMHSYLEAHRADGTMAEIKFKTEVLKDHFLSGVCDVYDSIHHKLVDWKTATIWKIKFADFSDWKRQALIYTWLLKKSNYEVNKVEFWAFMKDWSPRELRMAKLKGESYPETAWFKWEFVPTEQDLIDIEKYIYEWFYELVELEDLPDEKLPYCGDDQTWYSGDTWAVYKLNAKGERYAKASKVCKSLSEASDWVGAQTSGTFDIAKRKGEHKKCLDYCPCAKFCKFYNTIVKKEEEE